MLSIVYYHHQAVIAAALWMISTQHMRLLLVLMFWILQRVCHILVLVFTCMLDGAEAWEAALRTYEQSIDRIEVQITARLRDRLGAAKTANEMFRVFSKFNALFTRPRVQGAIKEYQTQLIERVKQDIAALQDKFFVKIAFGKTEAAVVSQLRDLPPIAGMRSYDMWLM